MLHARIQNCSVFTAANGAEGSGKVMRVSSQARNPAGIMLRDHIEYNEFLSSGTEAAEKQ